MKLPKLASIRDARKMLFLIICLYGGLVSCDSIENARREIRLSNEVPEIDKTREAKILTVFFGLDNALPPRARALDKNAPGNDGTPVIFSLEVDPSTLDASDFEFTTQNGEKKQVIAVTLLPAEEEFELRTALLIGDYGDFPDNPPVSLEIVGDILSRTGVNFKGQTQTVIPLPAGPILSYAEYFTFSEDYPYVEEGTGCDCPKNETNQIVKAVWSGGVRNTEGGELGDEELDAFQVMMVNGADTMLVRPFQLADLDDNDNNIDLCLKEEGTPIRVMVKAGIAIDPNDDVNPATEVEILSRW